MLLAMATIGPPTEGPPTMILTFPAPVKPPALAAGIKMLSAVEATQFGTTLRGLEMSRWLRQNSNTGA